MSTAVILLFHGSRAESAVDAVGSIMASVRARGGYAHVAAAFLQHAAPDLPAAVERAVQDGADRVVVVPFFMQSGAHVTEDLPHVIRRIRARYPGIGIDVTPAVGTHELMAEIVVDLVTKSSAA